jgi:hypothetical protein
MRVRPSTTCQRPHFFRCRGRGRGSRQEDPPGRRNAAARRRERCRRNGQAGAEVMRRAARSQPETPPPLHAVSPAGPSDLQQRGGQTCGVSCGPTPRLRATARAAGAPKMQTAGRWLENACAGVNCKRHQPTQLMTQKSMPPAIADRVVRTLPRALAAAVDGGETGPAGAPDRRPRKFPAGGAHQ